VLAASHGAAAKSATAAVVAVPNATAVLRAMMRPARCGFVTRSSATYFVAVKPSPIPAKTPNIPTVLWIMPYSPNCSRPKSLAVMTDAAKPQPCEITAPTRDQTAPLAKRPRSESAAHVSVIALVAPFHDLISVGIKSSLPESPRDNTFQLNRGEFSRPAREYVRDPLARLAIPVRIMPASHALVGVRIIQ